jgi:hypothetical protein
MFKDYERTEAVFYSNAFRRPAALDQRNWLDLALEAGRGLTKSSLDIK